MIEIKPGEPFKLPNGDVVLPVEGPNKVVSSEEYDAAKEQEAVIDELSDALESPMTNEFTETFKRTLADVTDTPQRMNLVMLVASYTIWGLDEYATGRLLGLTENQVAVVKRGDLYTDLSRQLIEAMRYAEQATVHGFIAQRATVAASTLVGLLNGKTKPEVKLAAARDVLDRAGYRPVDRVEHVHRFDDELKIKYITDEPLPMIDVTGE